MYGLSTCGCVFLQCMKAAGPLNILLITSDQHHWTGLGYNNPAVKTPHLDKLAAQGTVYDRAYCPNPTCSPTRASIITGVYPSQHGCYSLGTKLPESVPTVGDSFREAGYATGLIGKAHFQPLRSTREYPSLEAYPLLQDLEFWKTFHGPFYGFDHVELCRNHTDEAHVGQHYALWMEQKGFSEWRDCFAPPTGTRESQQWTWNLPEEFHYNTWIAERSMAYLEDCQEQKRPFFLWASFFDPHPSYLAPSPWDSLYDPETVQVPSALPDEHANNPLALRMTQLEEPDFSPYHDSPDGSYVHGYHSHVKGRETLKKDIAVYYGMISCLDKYVGKILDRLETLGLAENTLVVFTSDHGHLFGQHGLVAKLPFHYEDLIKVPFIVRWPGHRTGERCDSLQSLVDLAPTFLSAAGIPVPRTMTGKDQSGVWAGSRDRVRDHVIVENHHQPRRVQVQTYVNQRYKISIHFGTEEGELYDLESDPEEVRNLWNDPASATLKAHLMELLLQANLEREPVWMPRIALA